jgi:hypothetical protein
MEAKMGKRTVNSADAIDDKFGRGKRGSNATPKNVDTTSNETDDPMIKKADKEARMWHGARASGKGWY